MSHKFITSNTLSIDPDLGKKITEKLQIFGINNISYTDDLVNVSKGTFNTINQLMILLVKHQKSSQEQIDSINVNWDDIKTVGELLETLQISTIDIKNIKAQSSLRINKFIDNYHGNNLSNSDLRIVKNYPEIFNILDTELKDAKTSIKNYHKIYQQILNHFSQNVDERILGNLKSIIKFGGINELSKIIDAKQYYNLIKVMENVMFVDWLQIIKKIPTHILVVMLEDHKNYLMLILKKYGTKSCNINWGADNFKVYNKYLMNHDLDSYFKIILKKGKLPKK